MIKKYKYINPLTIQLTMLVLGIISGLSGISYLHMLGEFIANSFIRIFHFISIPIISLSIIVTLSGFSSEKSMSVIWKRTILYTLSTTLVAASVSCLLYLLIQPQNIVTTTANTLITVANQDGYMSYLKNIIPNNLFAPFLESQVMQILIIGVAIGLAIRLIPDAKAKDTVLYFFKGLHGIFFVITKWVVMILPIGVFGFITVVTTQLENGINFNGLGQYLSVIVLANLAQGLIVLPLWLKLKGISPLNMMRDMAPALSLAFFSKSSAGTLPVTIASAENRANINPIVSRFVLPLCTTINMNGCAAFIFATVIYLMQNHGVEIHVTTMIIWVFIASISAIGNAGVPMGCFFLSTSLLTTMGMPITLMAIILPFYTFIDMIETSLNVWSDSCVAKVVDKTIMLPWVNPRNQDK